ncbi:hypothetical protein ACHAXM_009265 [Skeletonema potamos]
MSNQTVISWRDSSNERKDTHVNASITSLNQLFVKDGSKKKRNTPSKVLSHIQHKSSETIEGKNSEVDTDDSSSEEETNRCEDLSTTTTPTHDEIDSSTARLGDSSLSNYAIKPELWNNFAASCIELNDQANRLYGAARYDAALEALHGAERQWQKLFELVQIERYAQLYCQIVHHNVSDCRQFLPILADHTSMRDRINTTEDAAEAKSNYIYQRSDFDEGIRLFEGMQSIDMESFSVAGTQSDLIQVCPIVKATITFNIGQVILRLGDDLDRAYKCYKDALGMLKNATASSGCEVLIPIMNNLGYLSYHRGDLHRAKETYTQAYLLAKKVHGPQHSYVASALNCLGVLYYHSNSLEPKYDNTNDAESSYVKAIRCFKEALSILETLGNGNDAVRATILNNCGRIHVQRDQFDTALTYYEDSLRIRRHCLGMNSLDYAATCFNAGQSYHQKGDLERAKYLYKEFLRVALMKLGRSHRDVAVVLSGMAQIHQEQCQYDEALELYEESLSAGREALGDDHTEIAMLLNRMGNFHFERGRLEDALSCYRRGLAIEKKVLPVTHPNILVTMSNIGEIYRHEQKWDDAAEIYAECIGILRKKHGINDHIDISNVLQTLGLVESQRGNSSVALKYLEESLSMKRRLVGNNHVDISATLVYIAAILARKRNFAAAMELLSEALMIRENALGRNNKEVAFVLYHMGAIHQQRSHHEAAIASFSETLRIEKAALGERHRDIAMTLFKLGEAYKAASNLDAALKSFEESVSILRGPSDITDRERPSARSDRILSIARGLNEIGNIYLALGDAAAMMEALNEASRLYRQAGMNANNVIVNPLFVIELPLPEGAPAA